MKTRTGTLPPPEVSSCVQETMSFTEVSICCMRNWYKKICGSRYHSRDRENMFFTDSFIDQTGLMLFFFVFKMRISHCHPNHAEPFRFRTRQCIALAGRDPNRLQRPLAKLRGLHIQIIKDFHSSSTVCARRVCLCVLPILLPSKSQKSTASTDIQSCLPVRIPPTACAAVYPPSDHTSQRGSTRVYHAHHASFCEANSRPNPALES